MLWQLEKMAQYVSLILLNFQQAFKLQFFKNLILIKVSMHQERVAKTETVPKKTLFGGLCGNISKK